MRNQLIQYVELLFAGTDNCGEVKQEILQNTLDRFDDLISQGKSQEAAYRLAISGIGDISEILASVSQSGQPDNQTVKTQKETDSSLAKIMRACAIGLYIICPIPLFVLSELGLETIGLCGTLAIVAIATVIITLFKKKQPDAQTREKNQQPYDPKKQLKESISGIITAIGLAIYLLISFSTRAWHITWLIFLICGAVKGLIYACIDLKEAANHEN